MSAVVIVEDVAHDGIILGREVFVDLIEPISLDDLVGDDDFVLGTKIDAFLGLLDATNDATRDTQATEDQRPLNDLMRRTNDAQLNDGSVQSQKWKIVGNLMIRRDGVKNEIEGSRGGSHAGFVGRDDELRGAEFQRRILLRRRRGNSGDFVAHGSRQSNAHLTQTSDARHPDAEIALQRPPMRQRRIERDSRAKDRTGRLEWVILRDLNDVALMDGERAGISPKSEPCASGDVAVGDGTAVRHGHAVFAVLLLRLVALTATHARVDDASDADAIPDSHRLDVGADGRYHAGELVTGNQRPLRDAHVVVGEVDVGVANATVQNVEFDIIGARVTSFDRDRLENVVFRRAGVSEGLVEGGHVHVKGITGKVWRKAVSIE